MEDFLKIFRQFTFDSAHYLTGLPEGHKCSRVHGHTYRLKVFVEGEMDPRLGWIIDFSEIKTATESVIGRLDHRVLNDVAGLEQPTTERISEWIWTHLKPILPGLCKLELWENTNSGCVYEGDRS